DLARPLTWQQVAALGGSRLAIHAKLAQEAYQLLISKDIPARLYVQSVQFVPVDSQKCQVTPYSPLNPLRVPLRVAQVLHYFDGRATSEAVKTIAREHQLRLAPGLLRKLVDFKVLVAAERPIDLV